MSCWLMLLVAALGMLSSGCGCCRVAIDLSDPEPEGSRLDEPDDDAPFADLGDAAFPAGNGEGPVRHPWWLPRLEPKKYRLGYKVPRPNADAIRAEYHGWARRMGHKKVDDNRFQWSPPRKCFGGLHCVYDELDEENLDGVEPIAALFRKRATDASLSSLDLAELVITFVQEIEYRVPGEEPFGVKPPALVVKEKDGDCDSKSLLLHMILRSLGIDSVLISSEAHKHTMLGLALPAAGTSFTWRSRKYAFVETTAKRSPIGHINPQLLRPNDWRVVPMEYKAPGPPPEAAKRKPRQKRDRSRDIEEIITGGRIRID